MAAARAGTRAAGRPRLGLTAVRAHLADVARDPPLPPAGLSASTRSCHSHQSCDRTAPHHAHEPFTSPRTHSLFPSRSPAPPPSAKRRPPAPALRAPLGPWRRGPGPGTSRCEAAPRPGCWPSSRAAAAPAPAAGPLQQRRGPARGPGLRARAQPPRLARRQRWSVRAERAASRRGVLPPARAGTHGCVLPRPAQAPRRPAFARGSAVAAASDRPRGPLSPPTRNLCRPPSSARPPPHPLPPRRQLYCHRRRPPPPPRRPPQRPWPLPRQRR
jgi:hypothetical protein